MAHSFLTCDREKALLLPPSLRDWLAEDHLAWFVLDAVDELDLAAFCGEYREDSWVRAACDPGLMAALLVYAYAIGERSSRAIERRCREDVAFRVITANQMPDHATIARFRVRHQDALASIRRQGEVRVVLGGVAGSGGSGRWRWGMRWACSARLGRFGRVFGQRRARYVRLGAGGLAVSVGWALSRRRGACPGA